MSKSVSAANTTRGSSPTAAPTQLRPFGDWVYRAYIRSCALVIPGLLILLAIVIAWASWPAIQVAGTDLVFGSIWDV
ncbi:MAG: hypothetical protein ABI120_17080, partial [Gemmatimonadaceae bacterium]